MSISKERRNEIAWLLLINVVKKEGLGHLKPNEFQRQLKSKATEMEIDIEEAMEFGKELIIPLVNNLFVEKKKKQ